MWGMRWTGTGEYVGYALIGLALAAAWLWWRAPAQLQRAEARAPSPPASHPVRRGRKAPARIPGDDQVPGDDRLRQRKPLTAGERAKFDAIRDNYTNAQQGESK